MNKLTPQEFLNSTEYNYLTKDEKIRGNQIFWLHLNRPEDGLSRCAEIIWNSKGVYFIDKRLLYPIEEKLIDWTGFDCSKPLKRSK